MTNKLNLFFPLKAGYPPFWSTQRVELFNLIAKGQIKCSPAEWKNISPEAKDLLRKMVSSLLY
jgi:calcium-dependent protein kinase